MFFALGSPHDISELKEISPDPIAITRSKVTFNNQTIHEIRNLNRTIKSNAEKTIEKISNAESTTPRQSRRGMVLIGFLFI